MAQIGIATITSITECCFKNTVESVMSIFIIIAAIFIPRLIPFACKKANVEANEPNTCREGQTFVYVSKA